MSRGPSRRNWVFTLFNEDMVCGVVNGHPEWFWSCFGINLKYGIAQIEKCPNTERLHIQGYVEFTNATRMSTLITALPGIHLEERRGSRDQARTYCMKEETRAGPMVEFGDYGTSSPGSRTDLSELRDVIKSGKSEQFIFENYTSSYLRYQRSICRAMNFYLPKRNWTTQLTMVLGPPGTGKTSLIHRLYPKAYWKSHNKWWDGYQAESVVVMDEFNGFIPVSQMNILTGCATPLLVQVKGGFVPYVARLVIIITNVGLSTIWDWSNIRSPKEAILRRITELVVQTGFEEKEFYFGHSIAVHIDCY